MTDHRDKDVDVSVEDLHGRFRTLCARRDDLQQGKARIEATLEARKKDLKNLLDKARADGFDPNNLEDDIKRAKEVFRLKLDNFEAELDEASSMLGPMKKEIDG